MLHPSPLRLHLCRVTLLSVWTIAQTLKNVRVVGPAFRNKIKITTSRVILEKRKFYVQEKPIDLQITPATLVLQVILIIPSFSVLESYLLPRRINSRFPFGRQRNMQRSNTNTSLR